MRIHDCDFSKTTALKRTTHLSVAQTVTSLLPLSCPCTSNFGYVWVARSEYLTETRVPAVYDILLALQRVIWQAVG